jgi:hypothetical protein
MTTSGVPARHVQQETFGKLIDAWSGLERDSRAAHGKLTSIVQEYSGRAKPIAPLLTGGQDVDLATKGIWLVGPTIVKGSPPMFPVATASVWENEGVLNACVKVALVASESSAPIRVWGWRFDSAEQSLSGKQVPRPHPHAQPIESWFMRNARCLLHPHLENDEGEACTWDTTIGSPLKTNETHPAFPLRGETLPGLAMAFIVTLHGAKLGRQILDANPGVLGGSGSVIRSDVDHVLGAAN